VDLRPELEFVFRTLVELRVDMEELRREFDAYRQDMDHRMADGVEVASLSVDPHPASLPTGGDGSPAPDPTPEEEEDADGAGEEEIRFRPGMTMEELEEEAIRAVLRDTDGNRRQAAERLGIGERTLYRKIRKFGIDG
jgi:DNA-binding NtrC family response regulator